MSNYKETGKLTRVDESESGYTLSIGSLCCGLDKSYGVKPRVGDELTVHTKGGAFGTIRGMDLNGKKIFWKSDEQLEKERQEWLEENERKKQKENKENKSDMDERRNNLPECFKKRIDKFRENNERFRVDYEQYELFCCEEAIKIADSLKDPEKVRGFGELKWEQQKQLVPELSDGHSGNTFGAACHLAYWYLEKQENVTKMHGSLSPLVGSEEYGDVAKV